MRRYVLYCTLLAIFVSSADVWALGVGGGMRGRGMRGGNNNNDNRDENREKKEETWQKAPLPDAIAIPELNTDRFDAIALELQISEEQKNKLDKNKAEIVAERQKLLDAQEAARVAYEKAQTQAEANAAAPKVGSAAAACKACNPKAKWENALANQLRREQLLKYKASPEPAPAAAVTQ